MSASGARARLPALAAAALCLGLAGCDLGGEDPPPDVAPGALAEHVPAGSFVYAEAVVRPDGDLQDAIDDALEAVGAEAGDSEQLGPELLEEISDEGLELSSEDDLDYEDDVKPWLGQRVAGFVAVPRAARELARARGVGRVPEGAARAAGVIAVSDEDEAREALERVLPDDDVESREGADLFFEQGDTAVALVDDRLLVGSRDSVEAVMETEPSESLREQDWFQTGLETVGDPTSVAFTLIETKQAYALSPGGGGGQLGRRLDDPQLLAGTGLNPDVPTGFELHAADGRPTLEVSYGVDREPRIEAARRLVDRLPADAWAALGDPVVTAFFVDVFAAAFEVGFEVELGPLTESELRRAVVRGLGYDAVAAFDALGNAAAVYARGDDLSELSAGLVIESDASNPAAQPIDAARVVLASVLPRSPLPFRRAPGPPDPRFSFDLPNQPLSVTAEQREDALEVSLGEGGSARPGGETIGETNRLAEVGDRLGSPWEPLGEVDIGRLIELVEAYSGESDTDLGALSEATLDAGGSYDDGVFTFRLQLSRSED